jgi:hypothetical protein
MDRFSKSWLCNRGELENRPLGWEVGLCFPSLSQGYRKPLWNLQRMCVIQAKGLREQ